VTVGASLLVITRMSDRALPRDHAGLGSSSNVLAQPEASCSRPPKTPAMIAGALPERNHGRGNVKYDFAAFRIPGGGLVERGNRARLATFLSETNPESSLDRAPVQFTPAAAGDF